MLNFSNEYTEFPVSNSASQVWVRGVPEVKKKKKENFDKLIVAIPLPK